METSSAIQRPTVISATKSRAYTWQRLALVGVLLLTTFLHVFRLQQEGFANLYYAAAVKSMLTSRHDFFFVSFDSAGFVTVDKPPLGLWIQAVSAAIFGFNGLSLLLPQVVAGILSVLVLYHLVRHTFGPTAGLLAALALAITPISIAANRNNTMDSQLVLVLLLAAWAVLRAVETGRLRWLLLCAALVGLGFNIKMLQAFLVVPAFALLYLVAAPLHWWKRLLHLTLAGGVLLAVSLAWVITVDLTPADARPYVGSSSNNTVTELIVGHNGLARLLPEGRNWMARLGLTSADDDRASAPPVPPGGQRPHPPAGQPPAGGNPGPPPSEQDGGPPGQTSAPPPQQDGGGGLGDEIGEPGLLRLFNRQLAGQTSWLLPLAVIGLLAAAAQTRLRWPPTRRHQNLLLWAAWLLPMVIFFSVASFFHRYYLEMLAPAIAALAGAGVVALWADYRQPGWRGWLLPLALLGTAVVEAIILSDFPEWSRWLTPLVVGLCLLAAAVLTLVRLALSPDQRRWTGAAAGIGVAALLLPMLVWAAIPVWHGGHSGLPYAGPDLLAEPDRRATAVEPSRLTSYLLANQGDATYLAAMLRANDAAPLILATGKPVMALGGFSGGDQILTQDELREEVAEGRVRFFLLSGDGGRQAPLVRWVTQACTAVPERDWRSPAAGRGGRQQLFDCGALAADTVKSIGESYE